MALILKSEIKKSAGSINARIRELDAKNDYILNYIEQKYGKKDTKKFHKAHMDFRNKLTEFKNSWLKEKNQKKRDALSIKSGAILGALNEFVAKMEKEPTKKSLGLLTQWLQWKAFWNLVDNILKWDWSGTTVEPPTDPKVEISNDTDLERKETKRNGMKKRKNNS